MKLLYSNILPLPTEDGQKTMIDCFNEQFALADRVEIVVGYTSAASLMELDQLVDEHEIRRIQLTIGMYYIEGMPENAYHIAKRMNQKWLKSGIGEIRIVKPFKYHGKIYCFYRDEKPFSAIIGSANLGAIKLEAGNRRQYELSAITDNPQELSEICQHIEKINAPTCSANIADIQNMPIVREKNTSLDGIDLVTPVPKSNVDYYDRCNAYISFLLRLKVPKAEERHMDDGKHFTKSNIYVC